MDTHAVTAKPGNSDVHEGQVLGSYELVRLLGEGSMGRVFEARHTRLGREVAVKVLRAEHAQNSALVVRFFEEARTVNRISHAHIVEVFDFVEDLDGGHVFCVMELLRGRSLAQRLREGPLPLALVLHVARQLCSALAAAHAVSVVHRDLKPDNIFLVDRPEGPPDVKVLDFGVAKLLSGPRTVSTLEGTLVGTPLYMSPEQAAGLETDRRADLYAVGNLLYEMLAGKPPFADAAFGQLMVRIITTPAPALPDMTAGGEAIPAGLVRLVERCLEKEASARPHSAEALLAVLEAPLDTSPPLLPRAVLRGLLAAAAAVLVVVVGTLAAGRHVRAAAEPEGTAGAVVEVPTVPLLAPAEAVAWGPLGTQLEGPLLAALETPGTETVTPAVARAPRQEVLLTVHSEPEGAHVTRADTGEWLGTTPMRRRVPARAGVVPLRISRPGRQPATRMVPLDRDSAITVPLPASPRVGLGGRPTPRSRDDVLDPFAAP